MKHKSRKKFILAAIFGFFFWIFGFLLYHFELNLRVNEETAAKFEAAYHERCKALKEASLTFGELMDEHSEKEEKFKTAFNLAQKTNFDFFVYHHDSLKLWTTNSAAIPTFASPDFFGRQVLLLDNGWYHLNQQQRGDSLLLAVFKIKNQYRHENEDLKNDFSDHLYPHFPAEITIENHGFPITDLNGDFQFSVIPKKKAKQREGIEILIFFSYLLAFVILLQLLISSMQKVLIKRPVFLILFPLFIVGLRYIWLTSGWSSGIHNFELFNPELFASSEFVPSLGDLIINVTIFFLLVHFLLKRTRNWFKQGNNKLKLVLFLVPLFLLSFYAAFKINDVIYSLVYDSKMSFDLERLFNLESYSFIGLAIIGVSFYAYFKLLQYIIIQLKKNEFELNRLAFLWALTSGIYVAIDQIYFSHSFLTSLWPVFLSGSLLWFEYKEKEYKFIHVISMLAFIAFYAAYILQGYAENNERNLRMAQAEIIAKDKDPFSEFDYDDAERQLKKEKALIPYLQSDFNQSAFMEKLESEYFLQLKNNYDLTFYLFGTDKQMVVDLGNYELKDFDRFQEIIALSGEPSSINPNIYFIKDYTDKLTYVAKYPIVENDSLLGYLITEMRSKKFPEDIGLPSLLLDEGANTIDRLKNYSIAKYVDRKLVSRKGEYAYPTVGTEWTQKNAFVDKEGYSHYIFQEEKGYKTIISKKKRASLSLFTSFSYLLIIYGVLLLIPITFKELQTGISFKRTKLNVKIQAVLIGLILVTLIAFAVGAGAFVEDQYVESNRGFIKEKLGSVKTELETKLKKEEELKKDIADYLEYLLKKFSNVFVTDINLYNTAGNLLASSQPKIYSKGLISKKMNTAAFKEIHLNKKSEFVHQEQIGKLNYLSAYSPFFNQKGEFLAYLNVQYISRQDEFEDQISGFLLAIIDIMVLMLAISIILTIIVSNRLTRPLKYIQESLKSVQIGAKYRPIKYEGTDEIGELVKEYNKKVEELQENAEALAKSERESAWREMAKQVAHEIKNPLTPMKLSIQHLKRTVNVADKASTEKLDRVSQSLIEQIDALTKIANEFSNFAKMPKAHETALNLAEILKSTEVVYAQSDRYTIQLNISTEEKTIIWADKDLLLRVFNNLIKNAIQAIPSEREGKININLHQLNNKYIVSVQDNGLGINPEAQEKLFVPYFTTKSKGTGLGLAMSKQIVESMQGTIWFETELEKGTTFYVSFPRLKK
ncbi:MAG: HAMP domain-containing sensor histidine kinase [Crocinitomicaceae bacterium]